MRNTVRRFLADCSGLEAVEYAIVSGLIVSGVLLTLTDISEWIVARFQTLYATISG